ncbi:MAG: glycosyltransferase family 1 protein [Legionellales bacterium]|nr:glycosyltransferase family 1 protein [Legionellales bacterium]
MKAKPPKICVISATPLTLFFFFSEHLKRMSEWADVTIVFNENYNLNVQPINAPVSKKHIKIKRGIAFRDDLFALFSLIRLFKKDQFDMVITLAPKAGLLGMLAARICQVSIRLNIFQGEVWASRKGAPRFLFKYADTLTSLCSTDSLAVSESQKKFLIKEGVVSADKISVLGYGSISGVDPDRFKPDQVCRAKMRAQLNIDEKANLLLFVGRINQDKGVLELVKSFAGLLLEKPDTFLIFAGPDEESLMGRLKNILETKDRHKLIFTGFTHKPEIYMAAADVLCLPSRREGFGMVALEAAASGLPSIGTDIYGLQDAIIHRKTGLLVPNGDEQALLTALKLLVTDQKLRAYLGECGRSRVLTHFNSNYVIENYLQYFKKKLDAFPRLGG